MRQAWHFVDFRRGAVRVWEDRQVLCERVLGCEARRNCHCQGTCERIPSERNREPEGDYGQAKAGDDG